MMVMVVMSTIVMMVVVVVVELRELDSRFFTHRLLIVGHPQ